MKSPFRSFFQTEKQHRLFRLLCLSTLLGFALVGYRMIYTGFNFNEIRSLHDLAHTRGQTFLFLGWNLFLAWIPYCLAFLLEKIKGCKPLVVLALFAWLVFLPNAPYLVTDLLHLNGYRPTVPRWYDVLLFFSFAWTGLLLGFLSLMEVQRFLEQWLSRRTVAGLVWAAIGLCAFGTYLGRCQRWNTWDLLLNPYQIFCDVVAVTLHPFAYLGTLGLAVVMLGVLGLGYQTLSTLVKE